MSEAADEVGQTEDEATGDECGFRCVDIGDTAALEKYC